MDLNKKVVLATNTCIIEEILLLLLVCSAEKATTNIATTDITVDNIVIKSIYLAVPAARISPY